MDLSLFDYAFPKELVAQRPLELRDRSKMLVLDRATGAREHRHFFDLHDYLRSGDLLVMNNADADLVPFEGQLVPALPPYIKRKKLSDFSEEDYKRYKTVYASTPGSKAAPTAGFHFTEDILNKIRAKGVDTAEVTLHVSYDTYKPIRSSQIEEHTMHGEIYEIPHASMERILKAKKENRRVVAVGTTTTRVLESWAQDDFRSLSNTTTLFITPGFKFQMVDAMITNFHRPRSTVLVMVSAFAGRERILSAYEEAIVEKYRLFSYGDCMLIL